LKIYFHQDQYHGRMVGTIEVAIRDGARRQRGEQAGDESGHRRCEMLLDHRVLQFGRFDQVNRSGYGSVRRRVQSSTVQSQSACSCAVWCNCETKGVKELPLRWPGGACNTAKS